MGERSTKDSVGENKGQEALLYQTFKRHFKLWVIDRIENSINSGIFDIIMMKYGREYWIELKWLYGDKYYLRPSQLIWMRKRAVRGADHLYILAKDEDGEPIMHDARSIVDYHHKNDLPFNGKHFVISIDSIKPDVTGWDNIKRHLM
jgi:hypothetical protein